MITKLSKEIFGRVWAEFKLRSTKFSFAKIDDKFVTRLTFHGKVTALGKLSDFSIVSAEVEIKTDSLQDLLRKVGELKIMED